ncbi:cellulose biosynthesis protein BcsR [Pectobacterium brasiliense]|uniref:cellulose biosynthesis protein BcsR n=1 Tax=Pectobacterium brasiliense TaxID=180957 RepID=UPI002A81E167|nr:cellulose biosynthesis protein BcsR [Pectobacterium brasiliense]MDY4369180.1 cellulose biosynthesis protein BcsR [Pectobacterium brasiliense]MDY7058713.1 cellulose biosynthesis protein BcsR [Pectobacterium brasiliense]
MNNEPTRIDTSARADLAESARTDDDLRVLSQAFSLPEISYIDIARQARLSQMMARWPLLDELAGSD